MGVRVRGAKAGNALPRKAKLVISKGRPRED